MSNKEDLDQSEPLAETWYGESSKITVKLIEYLGNDQFKVQFGDDDCAKFFSRRIVDLRPLTKDAQNMLYVDKKVEPNAK